MPYYLTWKANCETLEVSQNLFAKFDVVVVKHGGHCPENEGNQGKSGKVKKDPKFREFEKKIRKSWKSQEI